LAATPIRISVAQRPFGDWKELTVSRSVLTAAGGFAFTAVNAGSFAVTRGDPIEIYWGPTQAVLVGYVDSVERSVDSKLVKVEGRAKTADLVDCSPDPKTPRQLNNQNILQVVSSIVKPFGLKITVQSQKIDLGSIVAVLGEDAMVPIEVFTIDAGETAWEAISRAARLRGVLAYEPGDGSVMVTRPGVRHAEISLNEGVNMKTATRKESDEERFSSYLVPCQRPGSDDESYLTVAAEAGSATDKAIHRLRPLVVLPEASMTKEAAQLRAQWEATVRAAESDKVTVTAPFWTQNMTSDPDRPLWRPNMLVFVRSKKLELDGDLLIQSVTHNATIDDSEGHATTMELVRADAFDPKPVVEDDVDVNDDVPPEDR
jgi:prophage tail gpP-like protein